jgi:hypothetical protein
MRQSLGIEVMRAQLLMCLVTSGGRSLEGNGDEGLVNVKVVANISRFNRQNGKYWKNGSGRHPPKESFAISQEWLRGRDHLSADLQDKSPRTPRHSSRILNNNAISLIPSPLLLAPTCPDDFYRKVPFSGSILFFNNLETLLRQASRAA